MPAGFDQEPVGDDEGGEAEAPKGERLYLIGRLYSQIEQPADSEASPYLRWIYEKWNTCIDAFKYPDLLEFLPSIYSSSKNEAEDNQKRINEAYDELARIAEEKRLAAIAAAAKAKDTKGAKGKKVKEEEVKPVEVPKEISKPATAEKKRELNPNVPSDFVEIIKAAAPRPFTFGPIRLDGLEQPDFSMDAAYDAILDELEHLIGNTCMHGVNIKAKGRTLKRSSTLVKHARFLNNLQVTPCFPQAVSMDASMDEVNMDEEMDD
jgi:hypothetical protein